MTPGAASERARANIAREPRDGVVRPPLTAVVPVQPGLGLLQNALDQGLDPSFFWQDGERAVIGLGVAEAISGVGPDRLRALDAQLRARLREEPGLIGSRWFGGFGFEPGPAQGAFAAFGSARFVRPRVTWSWRPGESQAKLTAEPGVVHDEWARVLAWASAPVESPPPLEAGSAQVDHGDPEAWRRAMAEAYAAFANEAAHKVVLSRDLVVRRRGGYSAARVLAGLPARSEAEAAFAFFAENACFVGLTPERLLRVEPGRVRTEALAGTSSVQNDPDGQVLLHSRKDRDEHAYVVEHLRERLAAATRGVLQVPDVPLVRRLGEITHLCTPVEARPRRTPSLLELAGSLHPTPAVGGVPVDRAQAVIANAEGRPRGWYAGGVGWLELDAQGAHRGELRVALRSALLEGERARVFVGAGVVPASTVEGEWRETALKAVRTLAALGGAKPGV